MTHTEELIVRAQRGDRSAMETLIHENEPLVWSVTRRFIGRGTDLEDLFQLGCLGFLKAVEGFDPSYGTQFSTYAVPKIAGEIRRFLRDDGVVKVSRSLKERAAAIHAARSALMISLSRDPTLQELSDYTGLTPEDIAAAETATAATESINRPTGEDGFSLEDVLTDTASEDRTLEYIALNQAIEALPEKEAMVIRLRYFHGLTQQQTSRILGVSQVQISRIEKKALTELKKRLQ